MKMMIISTALLVLATAVFAQTEEVLIPGGEFIMGRAEAGEGLTPHPVRLKSFYMDKHEVTNAQWQAFCDSTDRKLPVFWGLERFRCGEEWPNHPVVGVSHGQARAYAAWVGRRLPTEAEWEYAARGGLAELKYDRADTLANDEANTKSAKLGATSEVASFPPNGYGLYDMVGNVREWVWDNYSDTYFAESLAAGTVENPEGPKKSNWRVIKGGGWFSGKGCNQVHVRNALPQSWSDFNVGFRCARDVEE
jgi:iron(II)-dependent oxidoreductase